MRDDSINIADDVTALHQRMLDLFGAIVQVADFSLGNGDTGGPHAFAESDVWPEGIVDSITVDNAETRLYENAVFQSFPTKWTDCMRRIFMAMLSRGAKRTFVSTGDLARWVEDSEEQVLQSAQLLLEFGMIQGSDNTWKSVN